VTVEEIRLKRRSEGELRAYMEGFLMCWRLVEHDTKPGSADEVCGCIAQQFKVLLGPPTPDIALLVSADEEIV